MAQKSYDKALYRLISILSMLVKDERPTIDSLAEEFNVSKRTIQTDVYNRLAGFDITKDAFGRLVFREGFNILNTAGRIGKKMKRGY
ncbi:MAG: HTH domain-containing protein [Sulfurimonas sp.]|uniref:HTH domain-containing protein n=1 Tax=Sulfurimonas sp. TaxID=2022749 RepID=UPI002606A91A|nr:HTH domain-containing protein [Sulfurimonas sp.]MDD2651639.1 HTH domain-containing protein [Sulfurimonas sp.]MDD3451450.1 HTH domain-containing protein [Sulfurimonas sp.]